MPKLPSLKQMSSSYLESAHQLPESPPFIYIRIQRRDILQTHHKLTPRIAILQMLRLHLNSFSNHLMKNIHSNISQPLSALFCKVCHASLIDTQGQQAYRDKSMMPKESEGVE